MGLIDSLKKLLSGGGEKDEQTHEQAHECETNTPKESECDHGDHQGHTDDHEKTKKESSGE